MLLTSAHEHVVGGGVPAQEAHAFGVTLQLDNRICEGRGQAAIWDLPNLLGSKDTSSSAERDGAPCMCVCVTPSGLP